MKSQSPALVLTIYVNSGDHHHGAPLYSAIVHLCHERGIAGATVFRAMEGYGGSGRLHTTRLLELGENLPVRIEIIDSRERIEALLPELDKMIPQGLITMAEVTVRRY
jgi:PII-like signaling protein